VTDADNGTDSGGEFNPSLASVDLSAYGAISQVRFTLNANGSVDRLRVDDVNIFGYDTGANDIPTFSSDPINKSDAQEGSSYSGSLSADASDPNGDPMTFSKLSGPDWLNIASNGMLSGTPSAGDAGLNAFTVQVDDGEDGADDAILLVSVETESASESAYAVWSNSFALVQGPEGNDDNDLLNNLYEFGLGGNPTNPTDLGYLPTFERASGGGSNWMEYIHVQQSDTNSGLLYYLELCDNLVSNVWTTNGYIVVGSGPFTNGFDAVTNRIDTDSKDNQFIRLKIEELL
jgi:hypothetical protein